MPQPMTRALDADGFHTRNGERFWSRPLYGPNRRMFVPAGELPHASFLWFEAGGRAFVRCGHFLPGVLSPRGPKWLYQAADVRATYDPGMLRFVCTDPGWDGEVRMDLVPLAVGDGYAVRLAATAPAEIAFAFGGFLCLADKDGYQGTGGPPGGLVADLYAGAEYEAPEAGLAATALPNVTATNGQPLEAPLRVVLLSDRPTSVDLREALTGASLARLLRTVPGPHPVQVHRVALGAEEPLHLVVAVPEADRAGKDIAALRGDVAGAFAGGVDRVREISRRFDARTPDTLVDLAGRSLSVSMDALWAPPVFLHGPIRWGWPGLVGWRMACGSDVCGTYERTASHLEHYGNARARGGLDLKPHLDPRTSLTRQGPDSILFSDGSIVNWGVYNMTELWLAFVAHHYDWTGDRAWLKAMWPAIRDALAFEKRAMDMDGDSLYENYANAYITDAHWHNGGGCTQASAFNHASCLLAAEAARLAGEPPEPYLAEAARIREAMNRVLWIPAKGVFAEWKDTLGEKLLHPEPELGSVYQPVHGGVADDFQAYQMARWTEWGLPNNEFEERGPQPFDGHYRPGAVYSFPQPMRAREVKNSTWRPIMLTVHECSPGEMMDLARVYYRLGLADRAFPLVKAVLRCMVNLPTVGGLVIRDRNEEAWARSWAHNDVDHCDTLGSSLQCLAEGLFGIRPRRAEGVIEIQPGFPSEWDHARLRLRDVSCSFRRTGTSDTFTVTSTSPASVRLRLALRGDGAEVRVNGQEAAYAKFTPGIGHAFVEVEAPTGIAAEFAVRHAPTPPPKLAYPPVAARGRSFTASCEGGTVVEWKDPQGVFSEPRAHGDGLTATVTGAVGHHTAFVRVKGRAVEFWAPVDLEVREELEIVDAQLTPDARRLDLGLRNNGPEALEVNGLLTLGGRQSPLGARISPGRTERWTVEVRPDDTLAPGLNPIELSAGGRPTVRAAAECWDLFDRDPARREPARFEPVDLSAAFNERLAMVHAREYLSPRSPYCSLQIAGDLFRDWCSSGSGTCGELDLGILRESAAGNHGVLPTAAGVPFRVVAEGPNIVFVSQWDNVPTRVTIPIGRPARHVYLLMASVTNPMQAGVVNGRVTVNLAGGMPEVLDLVNPANLSWCVTHYPNRYGPLYLTQPAVRLGEHVYGTIYSLPLPAPQRVDSLALEAVCNESVIGLMGVTLLRPGSGECR
ncbi:MAG: hypothetical protein NTV86_22045 [Planctomycetota bacterium]|nr:hypothetical protein [Planctomycetota bacterium]